MVEKRPLKCFLLMELKWEVSHSSPYPLSQGGSPTKSSTGKATEMSANLEMRVYDLVKSGFELKEFSELDHPLDFSNLVLYLQEYLYIYFLGGKPAPWYVHLAYATVTQGHCTIARLPSFSELSDMLLKTRSLLLGHIRPHHQRCQGPSQEEFVPHPLPHPRLEIQVQISPFLPLASRRWQTWPRARP